MHREPELRAGPVGLAAVSNGAAWCKNSRSQRPACQGEQRDGYRFGERKNKEMKKKREQRAIDKRHK